MAEMAVLQERRWGLTSTPIEKVASWEFVDWWVTPPRSRGSGPGDYRF